MTRYQVDSEAVSTATASIHGSIDRLRLEVNTLMSSVDQLQAVWTGPAATAFNSAAQEWRTMHVQVEQALTDLNTALGQAGTHYLDAEQHNVSLFARR